MKKITNIAHSSNIKKEELEKLPHLNKKRLQGHIPLISLYKNKKYHTWVPKNDVLVQMSVVDIVEGEYFGKEKFSDDDLFLKYINFIYQHFYSGEIASITLAILSDIHNLATCLEKLKIYHSLRNNKNIEVKRFVSTEIEYTLNLSRSMYDLFQLTLKIFWQSIELIDSRVSRKDLKDSFSDMVLKGESIRSKQELIDKFGLSKKWADFYIKEAAFFQKIKKYRDEIEHFGITPKIIFATEKGFAVQSNYKPFSGFKVWKEETFLKNNLAPLLPIMAYIIRRTIFSMEKFIPVLSNFTIPEEIAPGFRMYIRGKHIYHINKLDKYIDSNVWYE